jgi:hypothetical protein
MLQKQASTTVRSQSFLPDLRAPHATGIALETRYSALLQVRRLTADALIRQMHQSCLAVAMHCRKSRSLSQQQHRLPKPHLIREIAKRARRLRDTPLATTICNVACERFLESNRLTGGSRAMLWSPFVVRALVHFGECASTAGVVTYCRGNPGYWNFEER